MYYEEHPIRTSNIMFIGPRFFVSLELASIQEGFWVKGCFDRRPLCELRGGFLVGDGWKFG